MPPSYSSVASTHCTKDLGAPSSYCSVHRTLQYRCTAPGTLHRTNIFSVGISYCSSVDQRATDRSTGSRLASGVATVRRESSGPNMSWFEDFTSKAEQALQTAVSKVDTVLDIKEEPGTLLSPSQGESATETAASLTCNSKVHTVPSTIR